MRHQRYHEVAEGAGRIGKRALWHDVELRGAVLQATAEVDRLADHVEEHRIVIVRRAAEQRVLALHDLLDRAPHVPLHRARIGVGRPHRDPDRLAVHLQRIEAVLSHEGLGVGQLVVIRRGVRPALGPAAPQRRGYLPARGQGESDLGRALQLPLLVEEHIGAEELPEVTRNAREREVDRVSEVVELRGHPIALAGHDAPRVLVEPVPEERLALRVLRAEVAHVARVVLDLVAAGTPRGEGDVECVPAARWKLGAHVE